ncbi:DUF3102 domain-containing protein [Leptospira idonii]|uniref:DUF3102 domain-containing protein n=1 Tax=Leptospira idonii TaxID=1193500 RepID=A0A4R9M499_9LEPT|nr:DUF3102 domain-containing protein [Leptospira idonii]TGN20801.1 DUF3102 domain-containing protein [Leptospira idonii]
MGNRLSSLTGSRPGASKVEKDNSLSVDRSALRIIELHDSVIGGMRNVLQNSILIGEELSKKKQELGHGNWIPWIEGNLPFSERSARNYIRLFENKEVLNRQPIADLKSAIKFLSDSSGDEKEINPSKNPTALYKEFREGKSLTKNERLLLREWLNDKAESLKSKASELEKEAKKLK